MAFKIETDLIAKDISSRVITNLTKNLQSMGRAADAAGKKAAGGSVGFGKMLGAMTLGNIAAQAITKSLHFLKDALVKIAMHTGRVEELKIVLEQVGKTAGYSASTMGYFTNTMKKLGIETDVAQESLVRIIQSQLNLNDAMKLARVAQDAAVVSGMNSSQALDRMIHGIVTLRPIVLRQMGIMISLESEYANFSKETDRTVESLTEQEKQQIALNAVLREGAKLQGAYEAAMTSASKQLRSTPRYTKLLMEAMSDLVQPAYKEFVSGLNDALKDLTKAMHDNKGAIKDFGHGLGWLVGLMIKLGRASEQVAYWFGVSPRKIGELDRDYNDLGESVSVLLRWLSGVPQAQLKAEYEMKKVTAAINDQREAVNSLLDAEDLDIRARMINLQHDFKRGIIDEIKFREELEKLVKDLATSEVELAEKKKAAQIAEKRRQDAIFKMRKDLAKEIKKLSMQEKEFAIDAVKTQADEWMKLVGTSEEAAKDREQIEKWLSLKLKAIEKETVEKRKNIVEKFNEEIVRLTQGATAQKKLQLEKELQDAREAGVDRVLIEKYQQEKLAEIRRDMPKREEFEIQLNAEVQTEDQMAQLQQEHLERREAIKKHYEDLLEQAKEFEDAKEQIARVAAAKERALTAEQTAYISAQQRMREETILSGIQTMNQGLEALYSSGLAKNKAVFYAMKAASISEAIINAHLAATKALAQLGPIGGPVMAGIIYASSMMRVAAIAAQQPGYAEGGVVYPRGAEGQSVRVAERGPEAIIPLSQGKVPVQMLGGQQAPVMNVTIQAIDTQSGMDFLMKNKGVIGNAMMGASADNHPIRRSR